MENPLNQVTTFAYKTFGTEGVKLMEGVTAPTSPATTIAYDNTGGAPPRAAALQYPDGELTTLHWNSLANLKVDAVEDPLTHRTSYSYDATGSITAIGNPLAETITYEYDTPDNRLVAIVDPTGSYRLETGAA